MPFSRIFAVFLVCFIPFSARAEQLQKIRFGTNWLAQPEHGGFYQALVDGTYKRHGLDVSIIPGGPQANPRLVFAAGKLDFYMGGNMLEPLNAVQNKIPTVVVAAIFQKDPQILMTHPESGAVKFEDLKTHTLYLSNFIAASVFRWMQAAYGFDPAKIRPYTSSPAQFCADKNSAQQGYATSEPFTIEKVCGFRPKVFFLADAGYDGYSTLIETHYGILQKNPDLVKRFVDASLIGWYNYLYGDNRAANKMIKQANPEMSDERIVNSITKMKEYNIVNSGDALKLGIGAMNDARHKSFFDTLVKAGLLPANLDYKKAYTLQFVNRRAGMDLYAN